MYLRIAAGLLLLAAAVTLWVTTPAGTFSVESWSAQLAPLRNHWWGPLLSTAAMTLALLLFLPMTPMVAALVLAHGPGVAFVAGVVSTVVSAALGHLLGRYALRGLLKDRLARSLPAVADQLQRRSLRATLLIRMLPGAPFSLMNALAGSAGVPMRYFVAGTALLAMPIVAAMVWLAEGVLRALRSTTPAEALWWLAGGAGVVALALFTRRWLRRRP